MNISYKIPLADAMGVLGMRDPLSVVFFTILYSFQENIAKIIGWPPSRLGGGAPVWEILDWPLDWVFNVQKSLIDGISILHFIEGKIYEVQVVRDWSINNNVDMRILVVNMMV